MLNIQEYLQEKYRRYLEYIQQMAINEARKKFKEDVDIQIRIEVRKKNV